MLNLSGKSILVTGGTGALGRHFIQTVLNNHPEVGEIVVFSRDELKQFEMAKAMPSPKIRYIIGDIRDLARVKRAFAGIDIVVHAAAMKQVPAAEMHPFEAIKTNILGAHNVIEAALDEGLEQVAAISTDKAASPNNLYGATKLCADKLFSAANQWTTKGGPTFSIIRYGNVIGSPASVVPFFMEKRASGVLPVTHPDMTRFHTTPDGAVNMVLYALEHAWGGEIFVPKIPSFRLPDLATAIGPDCEQQITGIRPGEKLNEDLITPADSLKTLEFDQHFVICPSIPLWDEAQYASKMNGKRVPEGFHYASDTNEEYLSVEAIREEIRLFVDPSFDPISK